MLTVNFRRYCHMWRHAHECACICLLRAVSFPLLTPWVSSGSAGLDLLWASLWKFSWNSRTSSVLVRWTSTLLAAANFKCSYCCELQLLLLRRTNFLFTSLYPVSRVYITLSTLDSALLRNSEIPLLILILWLCLPNILKERSPYFLIFCINLFTMSTINCFAGNSKEEWTFCVYCGRHWNLVTVHVLNYIYIYIY